jgi:hypothetical protein
MSLITVDTENEAFPKENLIDGDYSAPFRFESLTGGVIDIDFLLPAVFDSVFLGNHNFDPSVGITIKVGATFPPTTVVDTPGYREKNILSKLPTQIFQFLRVEIIDSNTELTQIGEMVVGVRTILPRGIRFGFSPSILQEVVRERTNRGKRFALELFELERRSYSFRFPDSERAQFLAFWKGVGGSVDPFVWMEDEEADDPAESLFVSIEEPGYNPKELTDPATDSVFDYSFTVIEESVGAEIEA